MNTIIGARIRNLRETKGLTQEQVAETLGFSRQRYARVENGLNDFSYITLNKIAQILGITVTDITSSLDQVKEETALYRTNNNGTKEKQFEFIAEMLDTFYAHKKLYNSTKKVDYDE